MNFLPLEFYRPPVMLEFQNDAKVLGYICDSSSRTITPQLPDHPSQIKVQMIRCLLTLRGHRDRGSLYVVLNLRFSNLDSTLSNAFTKPQASIRHLLRDVRRRFVTKSVRCLVAVLLVVFPCDCLSVRFDVSFMYLRVVGSDVLASCIAAPLT